METSNRRGAGTATQWYALQTKPRKELVVWRQVLAHNLEAFYPHLPVPAARSRNPILKPYFPRYLFVRADLERVGLSTFQHMPYATGLVCFGGEPAPVADALVQAIQHHVAELAAAGREPLYGLRRGDRVSICDGPLAGYEALFDGGFSGGERVRLLLLVLGQPAVSVKMSAAHIRWAKQPKTVYAQA
jgi:transcriptional antiterminator RfaH